jgi:hypothetical protein
LSEGKGERKRVGESGREREWKRQIDREREGEEEIVRCKLVNLVKLGKRAKLVNRVKQVKRACASVSLCSMKQSRYIYICK